MWECEFPREDGEEDDPHFRQELNVGSEKTSKFLNKIVSSNLNKIPLPILASWQMKQTRISERTNRKTACGYCGISLRAPGALSLNVKLNFKNARTLYGKCNACDSRLYVGKLKSLLKEDANDSVLNQTNDSLDLTNLSMRRSLSFPAQKFLTSTPKNKGTLPSPSLIQSRSKKKKGSALSKLLQDDDSEKDRSLNSFLNSFSR